MNRSQRRNVAKHGVTDKDLKRITQQEGLSATRFAVEAYSAAVAWVLYDKLHFGKKKLQMALKQIEDLFDSVNGDYLTIEDIKKALAEECDIAFK